MYTSHLHHTPIKTDWVAANCFKFWKKALAIPTPPPQKEEKKERTFSTNTKKHSPPTSLKVPSKKGKQSLCSWKSLSLTSFKTTSTADAIFPGRSMRHHLSKIAINQNCENTDYTCTHKCEISTLITCVLLMHMYLSHWMFHTDTVNLLMAQLSSHRNTVASCFSFREQVSSYFVHTHNNLVIILYRLVIKYST